MVERTMNVSVCSRCNEPAYEHQISNKQIDEIFLPVYHQD